jgi:hypothetical protein
MNNTNLSDVLQQMLGQLGSQIPDNKEYPTWLSQVSLKSFNIEELFAQIFSYELGYHFFKRNKVYIFEYLEGYWRDQTFISKELSEKISKESLFFDELKNNTEAIVVSGKNFFGTAKDYSVYCFNDNYKLITLNKELYDKCEQIQQMLITLS